MNKLVPKFCMITVVCVFLAIMMPVMVFASEENLKVPSIQPQNNLFYIALCIVSIIGTIGVIFGLFLYLRRKKYKSS